MKKILKNAWFWLIVGIVVVLGTGTAYVYHWYVNLPYEIGEAIASGEFAIFSSG